MSSSLTLFLCNDAWLAALKEGLNTRKEELWQSKQNGLGAKDVINFAKRDSAH